MSSEEKHEKKYTLESVLTNLKIISNVNPNDKLTFIDDMLIIDPPIYTQGLIRWWRADSRIHSINEIEKLIQNTFCIIDNIYSSEINNTTNSNVENNYYYKRSIPNNYFKTENSQQLQTFSNELTNAVKGLQHLKMTYQSDISICSKIDVMIDKINIRVNKINKLMTITTDAEHIPPPPKSDI